MAWSREKHGSSGFASLCGFVAVVLVTLSGCSTGESPMAPAPGDEAGQRIATGSAGGGIIPPPPGVIVGAATHCLVYVSPDRGGSLATGGWSLDVPAHALSRNTVMGLWSFSRMTPGLPENLGAECAITPDGMQLNTPATLSFGYVAAGLTGSDPRLIRIYRLDLTLGEWVECPTTLDDNRGNVSTPVSTDSRYALGLVRGGF